MQKIIYLYLVFLLFSCTAKNNTSKDVSEKQATITTNNLPAAYLEMRLIYDSIQQDYYVTAIKPNEKLANKYSNLLYGEGDNYDLKKINDIIFLISESSASSTWYIETYYHYDKIKTVFICDSTNYHYEGYPADEFLHTRKFSINRNIDEVDSLKMLNYDDLIKGNFKKNKKRDMNKIQFVLERKNKE